MSVVVGLRGRTFLGHVLKGSLMRQVYHTIIKQKSDHFFVAWVEEVPGTLTHGRTLRECRANLREALTLMIQTNRDEARLSLDEHCITEPIEVEVEDDAPDLAHV